MLGVIILRMPICAIKKDCWHRLLEQIIGNKLFANYYLNNNYKLRTNMKTKNVIGSVGRLGFKLLHYSCCNGKRCFFEGSVG